MRFILSVLFVFLFSTSFGQTTEPADISKNIGKIITVYGKIFDGRYLSKLSSKPTFLDLGGKFPNQVATIMIEDSNRINFSYQPEDHLKYRTVWVTGKVSVFNDQYRININHSNDIKIDTTILVLPDKIIVDGVIDDTIVYSNPQYSASFPGGLAGWDAHVSKSKLPEIFGNDELKPGKYTVLVQLIVQKDSTITNVKAYLEKGKCQPCVARVLHLIKNSPKWEPATQNGYPVNSVVNQVVFTEVLKNEKINMRPILRSAALDVIRMW